MASKLLSQSVDDEDVGLFFVVPKGLEEEDCDEDMKEAFQTAADNEFTPEWKTEDSCLLLAPSKRNVFVFQSFKGPALEHLRQFKCVIIGPRCLTHCINLDEPLPSVNYPCFTAAMKDLYITTSGGGVEIKNEIRKKVELMGGVFLKSFTEKTTHVVVSSVVSTKYEKALELGIPVRTHDWVDAVWQKSCKEYVSATDGIFDVHQCPPFLDLKVCSSGLSVREQERLKNTLTKYGGQFHASLTQNIDVLVAKNTKSDKFKHAKGWNIPCVELRWIYECVKNGKALPTKAYEVSGTAVSSPTSSNATLNFSINLSTVQFDQKTHIDESVMNSTTSSVASYCPVTRSNTPDKMPPPAPRRTPVKSRTPVKCQTPVKSSVQPDPTPGELKHLLTELDLKQTKRAGSFLDGCGVYIIGWDNDEEEILKKVLKCSGASRFTDLNDRVSHVLVGNLEKPFLRVLKNLSHKPHVVNIKWLLESVAQKQPAYEEPFNCIPCENANVSEAPSPLSKKGMALLQRDTFSPKKPFAVQQPPSRVLGMSPNKGKQQLLAKYTGADSSDYSVSKSLSTSTLCMPPPPVPLVKANLPQQNVSLADDSDIAGSQDMIFSGLNFVIVGLEESTYVEQEIQKYGGTVVPKSFKGVPDYAVVPLSGTTLKQTATDIVTVLWLESCVEERTILPISYFHQPIVLDVNKKPLEGCVLGLSGYSGRERQFITELASSLGAVCQDVFAKKSKSNAKASSHLICKSSEGSEKFNAAIKWFRPAVYHSWLLACAASGAHVSERDHLVDPKQEIKALDQANSTTNMSVAANSTTSSKVESATVTALRRLSCFKTPERTPCTYDKAEVERILNYVPSPNPYEVSTPPVQLGISENPTPGESKRLQKWLNKLPEKLPKLSPPPSRRDSTPLHELRKRVLEKHGITTPEMMQFLNGDIQDFDTTIPGSAVAMKAELRNENSKRHSVDSKSPPAACSTPTLTTSSGTSRKLFDCEGNEASEPDEPIDSHLEKLNKLIATPEVKVESSVSSKTSNVSFVNDKCHKNQVLYDTLKDGSQPYAIKWEDPVNVKKTPKDVRVSTFEPLQEENSSKRKSSENSADDEPPAKRKSSESAENAPQMRKLKSEHEIPTKDGALKVAPKFSFSHVDNKEQFGAVIRKLGGTVLDSTTYNPESTHLLIGKAPVRSEKLLAFIAAGKWVLHINYLLESNKQGKFLREEDYEWGNPEGKFDVELNEMEQILSTAVFRWRTKIKRDKIAGAFEGFKCKILTPQEKAVAFARLIHAGGGQVLPENSTEKPDFCFINSNSNRNSIAECAKIGIPCLPFTFLFEHLTKDPPPTPESKASEEYNKLRAKYLDEH